MATIFNMIRSGYFAVSRFSCLARYFAVTSGCAYMNRCRFCGLSVFSGADAVYQYVVSGAVIVSDRLPCYRR